MKPLSQQTMPNMSLCFLAGAGILNTLLWQRKKPTARLKVVLKEKGGKPGKPHPMETMKGQMFAPTLLPVAASQSSPNSDTVKGRPEHFSCISKRAALA